MDLAALYCTVLLGPILCVCVCVFFYIIDYQYFLIGTFTCFKKYNRHFAWKVLGLNLTAANYHTTAP